jgi:hypothetical protein
LRRAVASFPGQETKLMKGLKLNYDLRCAEEARKGPPSLALRYHAGGETEPVGAEP